MGDKDSLALGQAINDKEDGETEKSDEDKMK